MGGGARMKAGRPYEAIVTLQAPNEQAWTGLRMFKILNRQNLLYSLLKYTNVGSLSQTVLVGTKMKYYIIKSKGNVLTSSSTSTEFNSVCECECCAV